MRLTCIKTLRINLLQNRRHSISFTLPTCHCQPIEFFNTIKTGSKQSYTDNNECCYRQFITYDYLVTPLIRCVKDLLVKASVKINTALWKEKSPILIGLY